MKFLNEWIIEDDTTRITHMTKHITHILGM